VSDSNSLSEQLIGEGQQVGALVWIPIVAALLGSGLTAFVTVKLKFSSDEATFVRGLKSALLTVIGYAANAYVAWSLIRQLWSTEPVTRASVVLISVYVGTLVLFIISLMILRYFDILERMLRLHGHHVDVTRSLLARLQGEAPDKESNP
jgi:hypothetical protein